MAQKKRKTKQVKNKDRREQHESIDAAETGGYRSDTDGDSSTPSLLKTNSTVDRQVSNISETSGLVEGTCIAGLSLFLTYLGDVVFKNVLVVAEPLVAFRNPILAALALGLLLHPIADRLHASLLRRKWAARVDDWCDWSGYLGRRALSSAIVIWSLFAFVSVVLGFLSIGLIKEGTAAARDAAALLKRGEEVWREYIVEGGMIDRYPALGSAVEWLRLNVVVSVLPHIDGAKEEALSRSVELFGNFSSDFRDIMESHGFEASSMPDPTALIEGGMSNAQEFVGNILATIWNTCKSMTSSPGEAWATIRELWDQFSGQLVQAKEMIEKTQWMTSYGKDAAGAAFGFLSSAGAALGSILIFVWRSFLSCLLFVIILFKLLQAESSWLEVALANFLPGIVPVNSQEVLVRQVQVVSTSLVASLGAKFGLMYVASYGTWLIFSLPYPNTWSLIHALAHTFTPFSAYGSCFVISLWSMYLIYETQGNQAVDSPDLLRQLAHFLSDIVSGLVDSVVQPFDGWFATYVNHLASPGVIYSVAFAFNAFSALAWANAAAERLAPEMPWSKFVTFGGVLLTVASWLSTRKDNGQSVAGAACVSRDESSGSIVSPWALAVSLSLYVFARLNPDAARALLFGS